MRGIPASIPLALLCAGLLSCAPFGAYRADGAALDAYRAARTYHLAGRQHAAQAPYVQALQAGPAHVDARNGLATLHAERRELPQAIATLRRHDLRADFAAAGGGSAVAAIGQALQAPAPSREPGWIQTRVQARADGTMDLVRLPATAEPAQAPAAALVIVARLEIRNGNGVTGMARAFSRRIGAPELQVTRLSNAPGFAVGRTRIEYTAAHLDAARRLAQRIGSVQLREVGPDGRADLRLVLGRDLADSGGAARLALR